MCHLYPQGEGYLEKEYRVIQIPVVPCCNGKYVSLVNGIFPYPVDSEFIASKVLHMASEKSVSDGSGSMLSSARRDSD